MSKTSNVPVSFVSSELKHRGLRPINLTREEILAQGWMLKQARGGGWSRRYFVLLAYEDTLFYFHTKPASDVVGVVPSGGFPLEAATVSQHASMEECSYVMMYQHPNVARPVLLGTQSYGDFTEWMTQLQQAIRFCDAEADALRKDGPHNNRWNDPVTRVVFDPTNLTPLNAIGPQKATLFKTIKCIDADFCTKQKFFVRLDGLFNFLGESHSEYFLALRLYYGGHNVVSEVQTSVSRSPIWPDRWLLVSESIASLPPESVIMVSAYQITKHDASKRGVFHSIKTMVKPEGGANNDGVTTCIGHVHLPLTVYGVMQAGTFNLALWPGEGSPTHFDFAPTQPPPNTVQVRLTFPTYSFPLLYGSFPSPENDTSQFQMKQNRGVGDVCSAEHMALPNPLMLLSSAQKLDAWARRDSFDGSHLPIILQGCDWTDPRQRLEAKRVCEAKASQPGGIPISTALHLLSGEFSSAHVRQVAAKTLCQSVNDTLLVELVLIIICGIRFEPFFCNPLSEYLLHRVPLHPSVLHRFFWGLIGNCDEALPQAERFRFLRRVLQASLSNADAEVFVREHQLAESLCLVSANPDRRQNLPQLLAPFEHFSAPIRLPLSPQHVVHGLVLEKCKVMSSNASPLWINFSGVDVSINVIIKSGDDLAQDEFALLFAELLNSIWRQRAGLEARIVTYRCLSLRQRIGLIEVVNGCSSIASLQGGITGALKKDSIANFFRQNTSPSNFEYCMENFVATLAGACVFEYLLGIGDRHGDNVLLKKDGEIFHIDFAYLMGNKTYFAGVNREPQPFTFSAAHLEALGGKNGQNFAKFRKMSADCFNAARKSHVFLCGVCMLAAGRKMPHLNKIDDVYSLRDALVIEMTDQDAEKYWYNLMDTALNTTRIQLNDAAHNLVQKWKK